MRCLVTGGAGFVGCNLSKRLVARGHEVVILDNFSTGTLENVSYSEASRIYHIDVREKGLCPESFDVVFHLAALARIQPSFDSPQETFLINAAGTLNVLEYARLHMPCKVVYAGSSTFYNGEYSSPYCFSKHAGERLCELYRQLYGVPAAIARFFNVYGPRQIEEGAFSTVIGIWEKCKREGKPLPVVGDGSMRRDFTHVEDICDGLIAMGEADIADSRVWGEVFNFGTGKNHTLLEVVKLFGGDIEFLPSRRNEAVSTLADISKAQAVLGYSPKWTLEEYISRSCPAR